MKNTAYLLLKIFTFLYVTSVWARGPQTFKISSQADYEAIKDNYRFTPGDSILFARGASFAGRFMPMGSGSAGKPIVMDAFGSGALPLIDGKGDQGWKTGADWGTLFFNANNHYWEINNLRIKNGTVPGHRNGIFFAGNSSTKVLRHIHIKNCTIDSVGGWGIKIASGETHGHWVDAFGPTANTQYDDILIQGNTIRKSAHRSISIMNAYCVLPVLGVNNLNNQNYYSNIKKWSTNIVIDSNYIENSASDGIAVWGAIKPRISRNEINHAGNGMTGNGLFIAFTRDAVIEYNHVYNTVYNPGDLDAGGIDIDHFTFNTLCQYNYVHDNDENGIITIGSAYNDSTGVNGANIRYNISANNARSSAGNGAEIRITGKANWVKFYNNVFFNSERDMIRLDGSAPQESFYWFNNIFYHDGDGGYMAEAASLRVSEKEAWKGHVFRNNCFYKNHPLSEPADPNKITADPRLRIENGVTHSADDFKLKPGSSCIGAGTRYYYTNQFHNATVDFFNNPVPVDSVDIGVFEAGRGN